MDEEGKWSLLLPDFQCWPMQFIKQFTNTIDDYQNLHVLGAAVLYTFSIYSVNTWAYGFQTGTAYSSLETHILSIGAREWFKQRKSWVSVGPEEISDMLNPMHCLEKRTVVYFLDIYHICTCICRDVELLNFITCPWTSKVNGQNSLVQPRFTCLKIDFYFLISRRKQIFFEK